MHSFRPEAEALRSQLVEWRRDFHQHPELAFEEFRTAGIVAEHLHQLGMEVQAGVGKTGVVGVLEGAAEGPTVLVRADMDALPIHEANDAEYQSQTPGKMHACGHDGHTAIAMAVARLFADQRDRLKGRIKFVFQPAEEVAGGAPAMIQDGATRDPKPDVTLGLHLWNDLPVGHIAITDGPFMASAADFTLVITGKGGHGAQPQQTHDPIVAAAHIISAAQTIVSRNVHPLDTAVLSCTTIHGGDAFNVIPSDVIVTGTIRAYSDETYQLLASRFEEMAQSVAGAMQCTIEFKSERLTPPVVNDAAVGSRLRTGFSALDDSLTIHDDVRTMGAEDVGFFLQETPGVFFFVGSANKERGLDYPHHHPQFDIDEESLVIGTSLLASAVGDYVF